MPRPEPRNPRRFEQPDDYSDGRTKQAYKDQCDVNRIMARAERAGGLAHLVRHGAQYGDFAGFDFMDAQLKLARAKEIFEELPAKIKKEFNNNAGAFFEFANDPDNAGRLEEIFPVLAEPGRQLPDVTGGAQPPGPGGQPPDTPANNPNSTET